MAVHVRPTRWPQKFSSFSGAKSETGVKIRASLLLKKTLLFSFGEPQCCLWMSLIASIEARTGPSIAKQSARVGRTTDLGYHNRAALVQCAALINARRETANLVPLFVPSLIDQIRFDSDAKSRVAIFTR